jgi:glyoxylate reductase
MKPEVFVTRHLPQSALNDLSAVCDVDIWDKEYPPPYDVILDKVACKVGILCLLTDTIDAALMDSAPNLKVISQCAVGYDNIDIVAATARGITVGNTPGVLTNATADFTFLLIMAAARRIGEAIDYVRNGKWKTWGLTLLLGQDVQSAILGIVGLGRIGKAVAKRAGGFDMQVLYYDENRQHDVERELNVEYCSFDELLGLSDFISLHVNLSAETQGLIGDRELGLMKRTACLINTSRGSIINSDALYRALKDGKIAYAALDVTDPEPLPSGHKFLTLPNIIVVPHIASATVTSRTQMAKMAVRNLIAGVRGESIPFPVNNLVA